jgi:Nucleotidyltransferase
MSEQDPKLEAFSKFIVAIEPWLDEVVLVGGWAHRLYRLDPRARKLDYLPLTTLDGDVAVPPKLKKEESTVRKRLLEAGFEEEFIGEDRPPATHYHYGKGGNFYAEFLAPLEGSEYDRYGKRKATKKVGGVSSQLLCYIEILLLSPWKVELGQENGYALLPKRTLQIANPASFLTQKIQIHEQRDYKDKAKDLRTCTIRSRCSPKIWTNCTNSLETMLLRNFMREG